MLKNDRITVAIMNVSLALSKDVIWDRISNMMSSSPYFTNLLDTARVLYKMRGRIVNYYSSNHLPKNISFFSGSQITHTLGKGILFCIFSEANFEIEVNQVYDSFNSVLGRMESRFLGEDGKTAGKIFIDSSEGDKFSVINRITDRYRKVEGVYTNAGPIWEVKPWLYKGGFFYVYKGSDFRRAEIIQEGDGAFAQESRSILVVPEEHKDRFDADLEQALKDLGGIATISSYLLFKSKINLGQALVMTPIFPDVLSVDFKDEEDQIHKHCISPLYFKINRYKAYPRHIHIDIGLTGDRLGIAATCITGFKETTVSQDLMDLSFQKDIVPTTLTDFAFGIMAKKGQEVPLYKVRQFIMWLRANGMYVAKVTLDGFQSSDMAQMLSLKGITTEIISVDRTSEPYFQFRNSVNEKRSILPANKVLMQELEHLEVSADGKKVDHPKDFTDGTKGSKDIADACCGSIMSAMQNSSQYRILYEDWPTNITNEKIETLKDIFWNK
jgi:hypothetical protein